MAETPDRPEPWQSALRRIRQGATRVQQRSRERSNHPVSRPRFDLHNQVPIQRVLRHHERQGARRCDDVVYPAGGARAETDITDRRLAEQTEFELKAVTRRPGNRTTSACPILLGKTEFWIVAAVFMIEPDESGRGTVNRMAHVIDAPAVTVCPRVRNFDRPQVIAHEGSAELASRL